MPTDEERVRLIFEVVNKQAKKEIADIERTLTQLYEKQEENLQKIKRTQDALDVARTMTPGEDVDRLIKKGEKKVKDAKKENEIAKKQAQYLEKQLKALKNINHFAKIANTHAKMGEKTHKKDLKVLEEINKVMEERIRKEKDVAKKQKARMKELAGETTEVKKQSKIKARYYTVISRRGIRGIMTMRGIYGVALGLMAQMGQFFLMQVVAGLQKLKEIEATARKLALTKVAVTGGALGQAYAGARTGMLGGGMWAGTGIPTLTGAGMEQLRLQSGLKITDEQLTQIGISAQFAAEAEDEFLKNFIKFVYEFNIAAEDFDDAIAMFSLMGAGTAGGTGALTTQLGAMAPVARQAGWDWREVMVMYDELQKEGKNATVLFNNMATVIQGLIEDDSQLSHQVIGVDGKLRDLSDIIWIIDNTMGQFASDTEATNWAIEQFGYEGYEAINAMRGMIDEQHDWTDLQEESREAQEAANKAVEEQVAIWDESLEAHLNEFDKAIADVQTSLATKLEPTIILVVDALAGLFGFIATMLAPEKKEKMEAAAEIGEVAEDVVDWMGEQERIMPVQRGRGIGFETVMPEEFKRREGESEAEYWRRMEELYYAANPGEIPEEEPPSSPVVRTGGRRSTRGVPAGSSVTHTTHNYITVHDNDRLIRDLIRVNVNV